MSSSHKKPAPLSPTALRTAELTNTRTAFRTEFEESIGWYNAVKLEEGVYFQYPDNIELEGSLYHKVQAVLKEIISSEPELAQEIKSGTKDLEALEDHPKIKENFPTTS
ncbi:1137_t:CDS:2 [Ambispora gerdemannii]|uniref:1137_t:CDS:1 n=1 Tax=Ambispora gerdemannii TaxID=144530 RepID=A0A9N8ZYF0_9GLOM|nr:1137_t:CDS:2 [Ambispora gerdemannii]